MVRSRTGLDADQECEPGLEALKQYQRHRDEARRTFDDSHHDWTSYAAEAFHCVALLQRTPRRPSPPPGGRGLGSEWKLSRGLGCEVALECAHHCIFDCG